MQRIGNNLSEKGVTVYMPEPSVFRTLKDLTKFSQEFYKQERSKKMDEIKERTLGHLEKIDKSDSVYIVAGDERHNIAFFRDRGLVSVGYVGISTSLEMGYAEGKDKSISLHWKNNPVPIRPAMTEWYRFYFYNEKESLALPMSEADGIAFQIGCSFAFGKPIYLMKPLKDVSEYPIEAVSKGAVSPEELLRRIKNGSIKRN